jgi:SAM-dependent methyltransferase
MTDTDAYEWAAERGERWAAHLDAMEAMLTPVDEPLIAALALDGPARIADVGCGGGATALSLLRRAPAGSVVHGFDVSPALVAMARERASSGVTFTLADMGTAAPEAPYDRLVSRFGVLFFDEPAAAFANLLRWLAPGGRFAFAVWARPADNPWMARTREVIANVIALPQPDPEAPGPFRYADADKLVALLAGAGFSDLDVRDWRGSLALGGGLPPEQAAAHAMAALVTFAAPLAAASEAARQEVLHALTACYAAHAESGVVRMDARVHLVTGARR